MRELLLGALSAGDKRLLLEGGTPRHELSGSSGPLRPEVTLRLREILVSQYTPAAWRSHLAWHTYWDQHGGFGGANLDNEQLMAGSPPTPRSDHRKVRVTWAQARTWVREEAAERASAAKASSDTSRAAAGRPGRRVGVPARTRHDLDRAAGQLDAEGTVEAAHVGARQRAAHAARPASTSASCVVQPTSTPAIGSHRGPLTGRACSGQTAARS